jgi:hypothetical protein
MFFRALVNSLMAKWDALSCARWSEQPPGFCAFSADVSGSPLSASRGG